MTSDAGEETTRLTTEVIYISLGGLVVRLHKHLLAAKRGQSCLHHEKNSGERSRIARHALFVRDPEALCFVTNVAGLVELSAPPAPALSLIHI